MTQLPSIHVLCATGLCAFLSLVPATAANAQSEGFWSSTGRLSEHRGGHTATLLQNGKVLVAGGFGNDGDSLSSAELYDPSTGRWRLTAGLPESRTRHTATLLPDGKVLVAGGASVAGLPREAELYDPATETWTPTGSLASGRFGHTATLLTNGKVLVAGGYGDGGYLASAELYDPATGNWSATGSLTHARNTHTATLLASGTVLVAGGGNDGPPLSAVESYDPATGRWSATGPLGVARYGHTSTRLADGRVLVAGGTDANRADLSSAELYDPVKGSWTTARSLTFARSGASATLLQNGNIFVVGGGRLTSVELYDPATGSWALTASLDTARDVHSATMLPSGQVLIAGGFGSESEALAEVYTGSIGTVSRASSLLEPRTRHTATLLPDGSVLVSGGQVAGQSLPSAEIYSPESGNWTGAGSLLNARSHHRSTLTFDGKVLVTGGENGRVVLAASEVYDTTNRTWTLAAPLHDAREDHTATLLLNGKILVAGGRNGDPIASAELYDPTAGTWTPTGSLTTARYGHSATLLADGTVLVAGGQNNLSVSSAELYDPVTGSWARTGTLGTGRAFHSATLLPNGKVIVAGGVAGKILSSVEVYDPLTRVWSPASSLATARYDHTATLLSNGRVFVAGGLGDFGEPASSELYDPATERWTAGPALVTSSRAGTATLLPNQKVLLSGGSASADVQLYSPTTAGPRDPTLAPVITGFQFGVRNAITGTQLGGTAEGSDGTTSNSAANYPLFQMRSIENGHTVWLTPDPQPAFSDDPMTVGFTGLPPALAPGWNYLTPVRQGSIGPARLVRVACNLVIRTPPANTRVVIGDRAEFTVDAQGGRHFQWEKNVGAGWLPVGTDKPVYMTEPVTAAEAGARYRVTISGACTRLTSGEAVLIIADSTRPVVTVLSPSGGDYWLLSPPDGAPHTRVVSWSMSDDVRICAAAVSLLYSLDGGVTYTAAPPDPFLPKTFGSAGGCASPGLQTTSLTYPVPTFFPSGRPGSLYKIEVIVTDQAGNTGRTVSVNAFYIVQPNPDSVRTLILWNPGRMISRQRISPEVASGLGDKLAELANHPRVQGVVIDLGTVTGIQSLYAEWDADPANARKANDVLFAPGGIHEYVRANLITAYSGVRYVILAGDDRIIPMARIQDHTVLLPEQSYPAGGDLTPSGTTVGQAFAAGKYLTDDPLAVLDPVTTDQLDGTLFLPDLAVGRLVETPQQIINTIATYIGQDGILDLSAMDPVNGHKVLLTGYDFLSNVATEERDRWKRALRAATPDNAVAPMDGTLIGGGWNLGSVEARAKALRAKLSGNGGQHYGVMALAGHATHYEEGVPGNDAFDIEGLSATEIYGSDGCGTASTGALDLSGGIVYAIGCHGGVCIPGSCRTDADHSLDLPEAMLSRGVAVYIANSGYGWSLRFGIGYGARLSQIFTEQLTAAGTVVVGEAVRQSKQRYYLETPRYDSYDEKTLMQWTLYGLPMYALKTGIAPSATASPRVLAESSAADEMLGGIRVQPRVAAAAARPLTLPPSLTQLNLSFDFTGANVYEKRDSAGRRLADGPGCPDPDGCYYTLNGLVDRGTGSADLPIQPYVIYDSRLSGTSQHGVLWKGGTYDEESNWKPVIAELISNGGDGENHGSAPRKIILRPTAPRAVPGIDSPACRPSDLEVSSVTITAGEAVKNQISDPVYSIMRRYRNVDVEVFYFNNGTSPTDNCDRTGPSLGAGPFGGDYHLLNGSTISWAVPATDSSGVWRVIVVYNTNTIDAKRRGAWTPLELTDDGTRAFRGNLTVAAGTRLTYVVEAVDNRGNVSWLDYVSTQLPSSGTALGVPDPIDVTGPNVATPGRHRSVRH